MRPAAQRPLGVATRWHTQRFCRGIEALVQSGMVEEAPGRAALERAPRSLTELSG
jgi:hypothetical protein